MADAKYVNIIAPGGVTLNYMGITGIIKDTPMENTLIKKAIERGCIVEEVKDDGTTIPLTLENCTTDNGGKTVEDTVVYVKDEEEDDKEAFEQQRQDYLDSIGELYKEYFENKKEEESEETEEEVVQEKVAVAPMMAKAVVKETATPIFQHIETTVVNKKKQQKNKFKSYKEEQSE